jgi:quercetin dioxygenase-like cupin family protein/type 1 glutamine amidotransferase
MMAAEITQNHKPRTPGSIAIAVFAAALGIWSPANAAQPVIALIGGASSGMVDGQHDYADGVLKLERLIKASPDFAKATTKVFPVGFPDDLGELDDASVIVFYFGSVRTESGSMNPAEAPAVRDALGKLVANGTGIVAIHQSFTVAQGSKDSPLQHWLGGVRIAVTDYTVETAPIALPNASHPIANGVGEFNYLDEFYPTIEVSESASITPILQGRVHIQAKRSGPVFEEPPTNRTVAWAYEQENGSRAFAYSGGHYLASFDQAQVRTILLNSILWAAHADVPEKGVSTSVPTITATGRLSAPEFETQRVVLPAGEVEVLPQPWGELRWFASRPLGNSATMTVGRAVVSPGKANPPHWHPNCDEILYVASGHIMHRVGDKEYEMRAGDTVVIPEGTVHNARNIGTEDAVLIVSFNSADRVAIGE